MGDVQVSWHRPPRTDEDKEITHVATYRMRRAIRVEWAKAGFVPRADLQHMVVREGSDVQTLGLMMYAESDGVRKRDFASWLAHASLFELLHAVRHAKVEQRARIKRESL